MVLGNAFTYKVSRCPALPVRAISQGDVHMQGTNAACVKCHRASGFGASEGGYYVPLSQARFCLRRELDRARLFPRLISTSSTFQVYRATPSTPYAPRLYSRNTWRRITQRTDPAGQTLAAIMPRYELSNEDVSAPNSLSRRIILTDFSRS